MTPPSIDSLLNRACSSSAIFEDENEDENEDEEEDGRRKYGELGFGARRPACSAHSK